MIGSLGWIQVGSQFFVMIRCSVSVLEVKDFGCNRIDYVIGRYEEEYERNCFKYIDFLVEFKGKEGCVLLFFIQMLLIRFGILGKVYKIVIKRLGEVVNMLFCLIWY